MLKTYLLPAAAIALTLGLVGSVLVSPAASGLPIIRQWVKGITLFCQFGKSKI